MKVIQIQSHQYSMRILISMYRCTVIPLYGLWIFALSFVSMFHHNLFAKTWFLTIPISICKICTLSGSKYHHILWLLSIFCSYDYCYYLFIVIIYLPVSKIQSPLLFLKTFQHFHILLHNKSIKHNFNFTFNSPSFVRSFVNSFAHLF